MTIKKFTVGSRLCPVKFETHDDLIHFGFGIYVGDEIPHKSVTGERAFKFREEGKPDGKIILDNGQEIYFCECESILTEEEIQKLIGTKGIKVADICADRQTRSWNNSAIASNSLNLLRTDGR